MRLAFVLVFLLLSLQGNTQNLTSIAELKLTLSAEQSLPLNDNISFVLESSSADAIAKKLGDWKNISINNRTDKSLSIAITGAPQYLGEVKKEYTQSSFIIDIDEASTQQFISGFTVSTKPFNELQQLAKYVNEYITETTYIHGFNFASTVAKERSGDCTEFAVLTTALARSLGLPAKVVLGTVISEESEHVAAYGHAWTEVWHNGMWRILDAALYRSNAKRLFYLPSSVLENEGPGYGLSLFQSITLLPERISQLRSY